MDDHQHMPAQNTAHSVPALFPVNSPVEFDQMERIVKNQRGEFEADLVLGVVQQVFLVVSHKYHDIFVCTK